MGVTAESRARRMETLRAWASLHGYRTVAPEELSLRGIAHAERAGMVLELHYFAHEDSVEVVRWRVQYPHDPLNNLLADKGPLPPDVWLMTIDVLTCEAKALHRRAHKLDEARRALAKEIHEQRPL